MYLWKQWLRDWGEGTEELGHAWRGSCKDYQVPNAEKTGLWDGIEETAQTSSSHNADSSMLHLEVLLQCASESEARVLVRAGMLKAVRYTSSQFTVDASELWLLSALETATLSCLAPDGALIHV